jgi:hypothetical protein
LGILIPLANNIVLWIFKSLFLKAEELNSGCLDNLSMNRGFNEKLINGSQDLISNYGYHNSMSNDRFRDIISNKRCQN